MAATFYTVSITVVTSNWLERISRLHEISSPKHLLHVYFHNIILEVAVVIAV